MVGVVATLLMSAGWLPGVGQARRRPPDGIPRLRQLVRDTSREAPEVAARLAQVDISFPHGEYLDTGFGYGFGAHHPITGRAVCDPETAGVIAAGLAVRRLAPSILTAIGEPDAAAAASALPPFEHGSEAPANASLFMDLARRVSPGPTSVTRSRLRTTLRELGWSLRKLGRSHTAPETRVILHVAETAGVAVLTDPVRAPDLVVALVTDVAAAVRAAEADVHTARQRCVGVVHPGNPIVTADE